ncbi:MAG: c-type cytochrome [Planctomycetes bacterium]|nr:c-type cytochrome [Planctomycetota bacterium]
MRPSPGVTWWPKAVRSAAGTAVCGCVVLVACAAKVPPVAGVSDEPRAATRGEPAPAPSTKAPDGGKPSKSAADTAAASQPPTKADSGSDAVLARGQDLFLKQCAICHGEAGDGAGKFAYLMNPRPRNFQQGNFKLSTTQNQIPSDDDLLRTVSRGMPGSAMPPWGHLPLTDLQALVKFVRKLHADAVGAEIDRELAAGKCTPQEGAELRARRTEPGPAIVVPPEPATDDIRWFRGRRTYLEACASCHGADGQPVADAVKFDSEGYPVPPRSFVAGIFKGGSEGHQVYARVLKGLKGTPMPASEGNYSADEMWDLIHFVQSLSRAGAQERAQLRQGTFAAPNINGPLPSGPMDAAWNQARALYVALTPLWWTEDRIDGLVVQALHNQEELALRISWLDPTVDEQAVRHAEFRDAVAVQFSLSSDPPFYMGGTGEHGGVNIWMWKADRQKNIAGGYQDVDAAFPDAAVDAYPPPAFTAPDPLAVDRPHGSIEQHNAEFVTAWGAGNLVANPQVKTPVECLVARGPGTLSAKPAGVQLVQGQAVYERGVWYVQMQRTLKLPCGHDEQGHPDERVFQPGDYLPVSFAIWNGSSGDRDGKKNISIWQKLVIE